MKKLITLLLALVMVLGLFAGCQTASGPGETTPPVVTDPPMDLPTDPPYLKEVIATTDITGGEEHLEYTLTQEHADGFSADLAALEDALMAGTDWDLVESLDEKLNETVSYINSQQSIAYILMSMYTEEPEYSQKYMDSTNILADAVADYKEMARRVYQSDSALKEQYFAEWTEEEIQMILNFDAEVVELEKRNAQILVEFRALDEDTISSDMIPLYREMVLNNNRIAQLAGYDNYYVYAYEKVHSRDYDPGQVQVMRRYTQKYIVPNFEDILRTTSTLLQNLSSVQRTKLMDLMQKKDFDKLEKNYVDNYLKSLPAGARDGMLSMFLDSRAVFVNDKKAHEGAFTTEVNDGLFCYFGPGYQNSFTTIHELGHYYAINEFLEVNDNMGALSLDLAEVHSQANEWLFLKYLSGQTDARIYKTLTYYRMYEDLAGIIVQLCIDEFEERVYTHPDIASLTEADFDAIMKDVCRNYGGISFVEAYITDIQWYWRMVVLESPVYYVSYAVSCIAALDVYFIANSDYDRAVDVYCNLVEGVDEEGGFLTNLERAGLHGPFEPYIYEQIAAMAKRKIG